MKLNKLKGKAMMTAMVLMLISSLFMGCTKENIENIEKEKIVKVRTVETMSYPKMINYYGHLEPNTIKNYAFKSGGKLSKINVKIGDRVSVNQLLATLDTFEVDLGLDASSDQLRLASLDAEKAKETYEFYLQQYNDMKQLYEAGGISSQQFDEITLKKNISEKEMEQANKKKQQAEIDYQYKNKTVEDFGLFSEIEGYVADIYYEEGELIPQGYPAITIRSTNQIAKVNLSLDDIKRISINDVASVIIEDKTYKGIVSHIDLVPNQTTRTYGVEIEIDTDESFLLGQDCHIEIEDEAQEGIWLNINEIMNDGADYVFVVKDGRAFRKNIRPFDIFENKVRVEGLSSGDIVIIEGKNTLTEGYKVIIEGDQNE